MVDLTEKTVNSTEIYKGKILDVFCDDIVLPDGNPAKREYIKHIGAACVVPVTDKEEVVIVRQFRYPYHDVLTEIPAGKLDSMDEDPLDAAKRELKEETGAEAEEIIYMGAYYPSCAYTDEVIHMYLAKGLTYGSTHFDDDEFIEFETVPLKELVDDVMSGKIKDGKTQTALLKAWMLLGADKK